MTVRNMRCMVVLFILFALLLSTGCGVRKVEAGNAGILVNLLGGDKGVDSEPVGTGYTWVGVNQDLFIFPLWQQNYVYTKSSVEGSEADEGIDVQTQEGMVVGLDIGLTFHFEKNKIPIFFEKYRQGVDEIRGTYLRNSIRDALVIVASSMTVDQLYGSGKEEFIKRAQAIIKKENDPTGLIVDKLYLVGNMRLPAEVVHALNAKIQATQDAMKVENQVRTAEAEARKKVAAAEGEAKSITVRAEAQAKANQILNASLTPTLVEYIKANRWNGNLPMVTGGATPFITLPKQ